MADYNSSYTGAQIDNAVGKASKLPVTATTDAGKTLQVDSNGNIIMLANGTAGQVLTMNSGATAPEWQTPSGGGGTQLYLHTITMDSGNQFLIISPNNTQITGFNETFATLLKNVISMRSREINSYPLTQPETITYLYITSNNYDPTHSGTPLQAVDIHLFSLSFTNNAPQINNLYRLQCTLNHLEYGTWTFSGGSFVSDVVTAL